MAGDDRVSRAALGFPDDIPRISLALEEPARFHVRPIKTIVDDSTENEPAHRHNFQEIIWIESGSGTHTIDDEILEISTRTFYLIASEKDRLIVGGLAKCTGHLHFCPLGLTGFDVTRWVCVLRGAVAEREVEGPRMGRRWFGEGWKRRARKSCLAGLRGRNERR